MSTIDKQRIEAVRLLNAMGLRFDGTRWIAPKLSPAAPKARPRLTSCAPSPMRWMPTRRSAGRPVAWTAAKADSIVCNLYSQTKTRDAIRQLFRVSDNRVPAIDPLPGIFPNYNAPIVRHAADGEREVVFMNWGFPLLQPGKAPRRVTNVRDDKILTSAFWRQSFQERRCLVPATSFCEPNGDVKPATWHWFALAGDDPRPLFAFPGIWRRYRGPVKKDGPNVDIDIYAILTTTPNSLVGTVNHERMPVLLTRAEDFVAWLTAPPAEALALARVYPPHGMRIVQEGFDKEDLLAT